MQKFLLTPLREGRLVQNDVFNWRRDFYSRPCGRGDFFPVNFSQRSTIFLLTPLREGRPARLAAIGQRPLFLLTPLREGRQIACATPARCVRFLLTPLREGRHGSNHQNRRNANHFYSRPCGRGDQTPASTQAHTPVRFLLTPLREGRQYSQLE